MLQKCNHVNNGQNNLIFTGDQKGELGRLKDVNSFHLDYYTLLLIERVVWWMTAKKHAETAFACDGVHAAETHQCRMVYIMENA